MLKARNTTWVPLIARTVTKPDVVFLIRALLQTIPVTADRSRSTARPQHLLRDGTHSD
jgi:hypothetical protein